MAKSHRQQHQTLLRIRPQTRVQNNKTTAKTRINQRATMKTPTKNSMSTAFGQQQLNTCRLNSSQLINNQVAAAVVVAAKKQT